jgi:predicted methyltransferase
VLPVEVNLDAYRHAKQNDLFSILYHDMMMMMNNVNEVTDKRLRALKEMEKDKARVAKVYNKKIQKQIVPGGRISVENHTTNWI